MLDNEVTMKDLKALLFEVYSAGFEAGYTKEIDIANAFNLYWERVKNEYLSQI